MDLSVRTDGLASHSVVDWTLEEEVFDGLEQCPEQYSAVVIMVILQFLVQTSTATALLGPRD